MKGLVVSVSGVEVISKIGVGELRLSNPKFSCIS